MAHPLTIRLDESEISRLYHMLSSSGWDASG